MAYINYGTVSELKYKELFNTCLLYLTSDLEYRMTIISKKSGISYDKIINIKKRKSSGNETLLRKLVKAFPELVNEIDLPSNFLSTNPIPSEKENKLAKQEDLEKLEKEVAELKATNMDMYKMLLKLTNKLLDK